MTDASPSAALPAEAVTYEYTAVRVDRDFESLYRDTYQSLGWVMDGYGSSVPNASSVLLKLKRPRHIKNRPQVVDIQRKAERALAEISTLEKSKTTLAMSVSFAIGLIGCAFLAGSVFAIQADNWALSIPLGAVGLIGWLIGYLAHGRVRSLRTAKVTPLIDRQYDIVYEASEQAAHLLA